MVYVFFQYSPSQKQSGPFSGNVDWTRYAYSQYATDQHYLCNSLMIFEQLEALKSPASRVLFYPKSWDLDVSSSKDRTSQLLVMARDKYRVKLRPVEMYSLDRGGTWDASVNKLYAWTEDYDRVIHLDSDCTLLQTLDELFFLPITSNSPAMPRAYWRNNNMMSSLLIVLQPSAQEAETLFEMASGLDNSTVDQLFDMEILNRRYRDTAMVLPHRPYSLVTGEIRRPGASNHTMYLGNKHELWNTNKMLKEAKLIHFSDWPLPKPHIMWPNGLMVEMQPPCEIEPGTAREAGCESRIVWKKLYDDFRRRRKDVCRLLSVPAPEWPPQKKKSTQKMGKIIT